jgi:hypothetical protein
LAGVCFPLIVCCFDGLLCYNSLGVCLFVANWIS